MSEQIQPLLPNLGPETDYNTGLYNYELKNIIYEEPKEFQYIPKILKDERLSPKSIRFAGEFPEPFPELYEPLFTEKIVDEPPSESELAISGIFASISSKYSLIKKREKRGEDRIDNSFGDYFDKIEFDKPLSKDKFYRIDEYDNDLFLRKNYNYNFNNYDEIVPQSRPSRLPLNIEPDRPPKTELQAQARAFRREKLQSGPLGELIRAIPKDKRMRSIVGPFLRIKARLNANTHAKDEHHRDLAALFAGLMVGDKSMRQETMRALDDTAKLQSDELKREAIEKGNLEADVIIVGAGIQGAVLSAKIRAESPDARIIIIDEQKRLGGQFRKYGDRPVFYTNGRNFRPQDNAKKPLPGADGNLNTFGKNAPLHLTDVSSETYPDNLELGDVTAVNIYMSANTMLETEFVSVDTDNKSVSARDRETGQVYKLSGKAIVLAPGLGERQKESTQEGYWTAEEVLRHFGDSSQKFPMEAFAGKRIAIKGAGDTGKIMAELFARLAPPEAYGNSVVQLGGPESIVWFGTNFDDRDGFCETVRPRYERLASFIRKSRFVRDSSLISPVSQKIVNSSIGLNGKITLEGEDGIAYSSFDVVIDAGNLPNMLSKTSQKLAGSNTVLVTAPGIPASGRIFERLPELGKTNYSGVYIVGAASKIRLTPDESQTFADGIVENTASIWANGPRAEMIGERVARVARTASQIGEVRSLSSILSELKEFPVELKEFPEEIEFR